MKRPGRKRLLNPIAVHLNAVMERLDLTKENICVACNMKYYTLDNVWKRRNVSYSAIQILKANGLLTDEVEKEYKAFIKVHPPKKPASI